MIERGHEVSDLSSTQYLANSHLYLVGIGKTLVRKKQWHMRARIRELNVEIVYHLHFMTNVDKFHLNKNVGQSSLWCKFYSWECLFSFVTSAYLSVPGPVGAIAVQRSLVTSGAGKGHEAGLAPGHGGHGLESVHCGLVTPSLCKYRVLQSRSLSWHKGSWHSLTQRGCSSSWPYLQLPASHQTSSGPVLVQPLWQW